MQQIFILSPTWDKLACALNKTQKVSVYVGALALENPPQQGGFFPSL